MLISYLCSLHSLYIEAPIVTFNFHIFSSVFTGSMPLGAILGGVFGGLVFFAVIAAACFRYVFVPLCYFRKSYSLDLRKN